MKGELERIWQDKKVRCPSHWVWWKSSDGYFEAKNLFYKKGHKVKRQYKKITRG